jgi:hypothetical protein
MANASAASLSTPWLAGASFRACAAGRVFATSLSESIFRKGDCRREKLSAVFSASSNTASPVLLEKSVIVLNLLVPGLKKVEFSA